MTYTFNADSNFHFELEQHVKHISVNIICEQEADDLKTTLQIPYEDEDYNETAHCILIDKTPLNQITDYHATVSAHIEKARQYLADISEKLLSMSIWALSFPPLAEFQEYGAFFGVTYEQILHLEDNPNISSGHALPVE